MEKIKLKIHEMSTKCRNYFKELKEKVKTAYAKAKVEVMKRIIKYEREHGYAPRCSMCGETCFCETYLMMPPKKHFWQVKRCPELHSDK